MLPIPLDKCSFSLKDTAEMTHSHPQAKLSITGCLFSLAMVTGGTTNPIKERTIQTLYVCVRVCLCLFLQKIFTELTSKP